MNGWGPKSSVCPSKPRESNFFGGISRDFAGISRKRPKSLRKKCLGSILVPYVYLASVCVSPVYEVGVLLTTQRNTGRTISDPKVTQRRLAGSHPRVTLIELKTDSKMTRK